MDYDNCYTPQCPRRETCTLWHNALKMLEKKPMQIQITNPILIQEAGGYEHCPLYYELKIRRFARGLVWKYPDLTGRQLDQIHAELTDLFGYSKVVRLRCGYEVLTPEEQEAIAHLWQSIAPGHAPQYRAFEEHYIKPRRVEGKASRKIKQER